MFTIFFIKILSLIIRYKIVHQKFTFIKNIKLFENFEN